MNYQELHQRYGSPIANKVQMGLNQSEFNQITLDDLPSYLGLRAEAAHREYQAHLSNPFNGDRQDSRSAGVVDLLHRRWKSAEEISSLVSAAEKVSSQSRVDKAAS